MTLALRLLCIWLSATLAAYTPGAYRHLLVGLLERSGVPNAKTTPAANLRLRRRLTIEHVSSPGVTTESRAAEEVGLFASLRTAIQSVASLVATAFVPGAFFSPRLAPAAIFARTLPLRC